MHLYQTLSALESLLFIQGEPLSVDRLVLVLEISEEEVMRGLEGLVKKYNTPESGLSLVRKDDMVQLVTRSENAEYVERFTKSTLQESLSKATLEVLAVIAYRGPIARAEIEAIRGVNCSITLRNLLMRSLIERKENEMDARGYLYSISFQFLKSLGLRSVMDLPEYESLMHDERVLTALNAFHDAIQEQK